MAERDIGTMRQAIFQAAQSAWAYLSGPLKVTQDEPVPDAYLRISNGQPVKQSVIDELTSEIRLLVADPTRIRKLNIRELPNMEELLLDNRYACRAFLKNALEPGEKDPEYARYDYERRRFLQLDFIPEYARGMCSRECKDTFRKVKVAIDPGVPHRSDLLHYVRTFIREHIKEERLLDDSHFSACLTFKAGANLLEALRPNEFKRSFTVTDKGSEIFVHDRFSPGSDGPLGKAATDAWQRMSHISLAAVLLEDLLPQFPFPMDDSGKRVAIERALAPRGASAWDIADSPLLKNAQDLNELYEAGVVSEDVVKVLVGNSEALLHTDLKNQIAEIEHAVARKAARRRSVAVDQGTTHERPATTHDTEDNSRGAEGNPKWEFYRAIHSARPEETFDKDFREKYAPLYRLYRSSNIPLQECIDIARADAAIPTTYIGSHAPAEGSLPRRLPTWLGRSSHSPEDPADTERNHDSDLAERYTVTGTEQSWFQEWRSALDHISKQIVDRRLARVAEGNFGDWRKIAMGGAYHELRIHYGAGQRLYYRFTSSSSIEIVAAGSKAEQQQILRRLSGN